MNLFKITFNSNRVYGLDILRAVAISFVLVGHSSSIMPPNIEKSIVFFIFDGVSIFFVLSGFLIGDILIKTLEQDAVNFKTLFHFWMRRWLRTLPAYFFILIILILFYMFFKRSLDFNEVKLYFLFLQNFSYPHPTFFSEAWSLSIEEWFYLIVPSILFILIGFFNIKSKKAILYTALSIILIITFYRYYKFQLLQQIGEPFDITMEFRKQVVTRLDSLMFGVLGAYMSYYAKLSWIRYKYSLLLVGILVLILNKYLSFLMDVPILYSCVFALSINAFATLMLMPYLSELKTGEGTVYKTITYISLISYSLYLLNYSLIKDIIVRNGIVKPLMHYNITQNELFLSLIGYSFYWLLVIFGAILMYKYIELPFMKLRRRTYPDLSPSFSKNVP